MKLFGLLHCLYQECNKEGGRRKFGRRSLSSGRGPFLLPRKWKKPTPAAKEKETSAASGECWDTFLTRGRGKKRGPPALREKKKPRLPAPHTGAQLLHSYPGKYLCGPSSAAQPREKASSKGKGSNRCFSWGETSGGSISRQRKSSRSGKSDEKLQPGVIFRRGKDKVSRRKPAKETGARKGVRVLRGKGCPVLDEKGARQKTRPQRQTEGGKKTKLCSTHVAGTSLERSVSARKKRGHAAPCGRRGKTAWRMPPSREGEKASRKKQESSARRGKEKEKPRAHDSSSAGDGSSAGKIIALLVRQLTPPQKERGGEVVSPRQQSACATGRKGGKNALKVRSLKKEPRRRPGSRECTLKRGVQIDRESETAEKRTPKKIASRPPLLREKGEILFHLGGGGGG